MKALEVRDAFGLEQLKLTERERPAAGAGGIVVEMHAAALNYRDLLMVQGMYNPKQALPLIPGSDGVGTVREIGDGVSRVAVGDRVAPIFAQRWISGAPNPQRLRSTLGGPLDGTMTELMRLSADGVVKVPEHLTHEEAATLPCAGVTAWNALVTHGGLRAGQVVLIQGTGGVSIFALQLATLLGARAIVTSSSDEKLERARTLGAWKCINYGTTPEWGRAAREMTGGDGVDLVIEVGGGGTLEQSVASLRFGGRISLIGNLAGGKAEVNLIPLFMRQIRLQGILVGSREDFEAFCRAVDAHQLRPAVHRVFELADARAAFEHLATGSHFGKVAIHIGS